MLERRISQEKFKINLTASPPGILSKAEQRLANAKTTGLEDAGAALNRVVDSSTPHLISPTIPVRKSHRRTSAHLKELEIDQLQHQINLLKHKMSTGLATPELIKFAQDQLNLHLRLSPLITDNPQKFELNEKLIKILRNELEHWE